MSLNTDAITLIPRATNTGDESSASGQTASGRSWYPSSSPPVAIPPATCPSSHSLVRRVAAGLTRQVVGGDRPRLGHGPIEPQLVAEENREAHHPAGHRADHLTHELLEGGLVEGCAHGHLRSVLGWERTAGRYR
jgi:hypothetical protein